MNRRMWEQPVLGGGCIASWCDILLSGRRSHLARRARPDPGPRTAQRRVRAPRVTAPSTPSSTSSPRRIATAGAPATERHPRGQESERRGARTLPSRWSQVLNVGILLMATRASWSRERTGRARAVRPADDEALAGSWRRWDRPREGNPGTPTPTPDGGRTDRPSSRHPGTGPGCDLEVYPARNTGGGTGD